MMSFIKNKVPPRFAGLGTWLIAACMTFSLQAQDTLDAEAEAFAAGELLPLRAIDRGTLPNSNLQKQVELQTLTALELQQLALDTQFSPAVLYEKLPVEQQSALLNSISADTEITPDIQALANSLSKDPVKIYAHFSNNFTFEPYYFGALKGAQETLYQKSGNDFDIASAMIATLRASGLQARYVVGKIRTPAASGAKWIGTTDALTAGNILATAGYQSTIFGDAQGRPTQLETQHVWVEYYHSATASWIGLAPAFKDHSLPQGRNISIEAGNDPQTLINRMSSAGMLANANGIMQPDLNLVDEYIQENEQRTASHLSGAPQTRLSDLVKPRKAIVRNISQLPSTLPFSIQGTVSRLNELSDSHRQHVQVALPGLSKRLALPAVLAKRLTVDYIAATPTDQNKINSYGGILNTPYKGVNLKPQLKLDGAVMATGSAVSVGSYQTMTVSFFKGSAAAGAVQHNVTAGGVYAVALDSQKVSEQKFKRTLDKLNVLKNTHKNNLLHEEFAGELLHMLGMSYYRQLDNVIDNMSATSGSFIFHQVSEALVSIDLTTRLNASGQHIMSVGERGIDAPRNIYSLFSASNAADFNAAGLLFSVGMAASALEHAVFEKTMGWPSVSTMSILRAAANHEIPVYRINRTNLEAVMSQLELTDTYKNSMRAAVNAGRVVITPKSTIKQGKWRGLGYIVLDPATGAAGYLINGGHAGGKQSFKPMDLQQAGIVFVKDVGAVALAFAQGAIYGDFNPNAYNSPIQGGAAALGTFVADFFIVGDIRNVGVTTWDLVVNDGSFSDVALAAVGFIPLFDLSKTGYKVSDAVISNWNLSAVESSYRSVSANSTNLVASLSKNADITSASIGKLSGRFDAVITQASRNGMNFSSVTVKDGQGYARSLGINPDNMTTTTKALLGEKAAIDYSTKQRGMTCYFCSGTPSQNGIDSIYKDAQGNFVITESKFIGTGSNFGLGSLTGSGVNKQMTDNWLFGARGQGGPDSALYRTPGMTQQQKEQLVAAYGAGKVRKQIVVVTDQHRGLGVTEALSKHAEFGGSAAKSKLDHIVVIELPIRP
ncbi:transglutaminase domain-containing protein [Bowmanella denitrificans]|uniref:transglutaminase domain-containing protein n=1 Tax=Bowmanella denitrificans TaxID=366582 RepID=UPI000C9C3F97|nr:transglutaminase domain-containing protein [Bowmanella denitrificans]